MYLIDASKIHYLIMLSTESGVLVTNPWIQHPKDRYLPKNTLAYRDFFKDVTTGSGDALQVDRNIMNEHRVFLSESILHEEARRKSYEEPMVVFIGLEERGMLAIYHVLIGPFAVTVKMLNINGNAP